MAPKIDRLSILPDELISHILSFLPTKFAVATAILSSRYSLPCTSLTSLEFDDTHYFNRQKNVGRDHRQNMETLFTGFVEKVLSSNTVFRLPKFRLRFDDYDGKFIASINRWIETAVMRNVVEMDVHVICTNISCDCVVIPPCSSLQVLKVDIVSAFSLRVPTHPDSFPNLRALDLRLTLYTEDVEKWADIFPTLPNLEKLFLSVEFDLEVHLDDFAFNFYISGNNLRHLDMELHDGYYDCLVMLHAPNLEYLRFNDNWFGSNLTFVHLGGGDLVSPGSIGIWDERIHCRVIKEPPALSEVKIDIGKHKRFFESYMNENEHPVCNCSIDFLRTLSGTKALSISVCTNLALIFNDDIDLPVFNNLTKLELTLFPGGGWDLLPQWLEKCPDLEILILREEDNIHIKEKIRRKKFVEEIDWQAPNSVPSCLLYHLKKVEFRGLSKLANRGLLKYLIENSKVLEKLTMGPPPEYDSDEERYPSELDSWSGDD